jgi:hypothetical protein
VSATVDRPGSDLGEIEFVGRRRASANSCEDSSDRRGRFRYVSWATLTLVLVGLSAAAGSYFLRDKPTAMNPPEDIAEAPGRQFATLRANRSVSPAGQLVAAAKSEPIEIENDGQFVVAPTAAEIEASSQLATTLSTARQSPSAEWSTATPVAFDPYSEAPSLPASQITPDPVPSVPSRQMTQEGNAVGVESSPWTVTLNELRASLHLFEKQIQQPPDANSSTASTSLPDSFAQELSRIEASLRMLECRPSRVTDGRPNPNTHAP